jgi:hypothetical protein
VAAGYVLAVGASLKVITLCILRGVGPVIWTVRRSKSQPLVVWTGLLKVNVAAVMYPVLLAAQYGTQAFHVSTPVESAALGLHLDQAKSLAKSFPSAHVSISDLGLTWLLPSPQSSTAGTSWSRSWGRRSPPVFRYVASHYKYPAQVALRRARRRGQLPLGLAPGPAQAGHPAPGRDLAETLQRGSDHNR